MITTILVFGNPDPTFPCTSTAFLQSIKGLAGRCPFGWCVPCSRSGFHKWGHPKLAGWFIYVYFMEKPWKTQSKMDDSWGYPHFRKPPYALIITVGVDQNKFLTFPIAQSMVLSTSSCSGTIPHIASMSGWCFKIVPFSWKEHRYLKKFGTTWPIQCNSWRTAAEVFRDVLGPYRMDFEGPWTTPNILERKFHHPKDHFRHEPLALVILVAIPIPVLTHGKFPLVYLLVHPRNSGLVHSIFAR